MVITGPCSIHDPIAALEYAEKLKQLQATSFRSDFPRNACLY